MSLAEQLTAALMDAEPSVELVGRAERTLHLTEGPRAALDAAVESFDPGPIDGFTVDVKSELRERDGRPFIYHRQLASDGRVAEWYFVIDGYRMATLMVVTASGASAEWRRAAEAAAFSLKLSPQP